MVGYGRTGYNVLQYFVGTGQTSNRLEEDKIASMLRRWDVCGVCVGCVAPRVWQSEGRITTLQYEYEYEGVVSFRVFVRLFLRTIKMICLLSVSFSTSSRG